MDIIKTLKENKQYIVLAGLLLGVLYLLGVIPTEIKALGKNTKYLYVGIIVLAGYVYWRFHWQEKPSFERTVPSRNLSNPEYFRDIERQRGPTQPPKTPSQPIPPQDQTPPKYSNDIADKFRQN